MLCQTCIGVLQHREGFVETWGTPKHPAVLCAHHRTVRTLEASAAQDCQICQPFWNDLSDPEQQALREQDSKGIDSGVEKEKINDSCHSYLTNVDIQRQGERYQLSIHIARSTTEQTTLFGRAVGPYYYALQPTAGE